MIKPSNAAVFGYVFSFFISHQIGGVVPLAKKKKKKPAYERSCKVERSLFIASNNDSIFVVNM